MGTELKKNDPTKAREYFEDKLTFTIGPVELDRAMHNGADIVIIDVRATEDFQRSHITKAVNLPKDKWASLNGLRKEKLNVLYCYSPVCHLAATAAAEFARQGYSVMELEGGFRAWKDHDLKVER